MNAGRDLYYEDVEVGAAFATGPHAVSEADIARFGDLTHDHHPLHIDRGYARSRGFAGVIAHGLLGLSLIEGLKTGLGLYENSSIASLGWDQVRFLRPVFAGDEVHVSFRFVDKRMAKRGDRGVVTEALKLMNQRGECVIEAVHLALVACRPPASAT